MLRVIGGRLPLKSFRGSLISDTINTRTYSTTIDLGDEHPSRLVVVGTACVTGSTEQPTACSVDGVAASLVHSISASGVFSTPVQLWQVAKPTGGSVTVSFSKPGGADMDRGSLAVWSLYYLRSQVVRAVNQDTAPPLDMDLATLANALVFGAAATSNNNPVTWSATGLAIDVQDGVQPFHSVFASAGPAGVLAETRDIQIDSGTLIANGISATWR